MTSRFGFWSAIGAFVAAVGYGIPQILQVAGLLPWPVDVILIFAPSLILAPFFVLTMASVHATAPAGMHAWSLSALSLAIMYAVLVSIVYVIQLGVVIPLGVAGEGARVALFECCGRFQPLTAVDLLGYTLMSISTLLAAPLFFGGDRLRRWTAIALSANGILAPILILQLAWPGLIYLGALWLITFPAAMLLLAALFRR